MRILLYLVCILIPYKSITQNVDSSNLIVAKSIDIIIKLDSINNHKYASGKIDSLMHNKISNQTIFSSNNLLIKLIESKQKSDITDSFYNLQLIKLSKIISIDSNIYRNISFKKKVVRLLDEKYFTSISNRGIINNKFKLSKEKVMSLFQETHKHLDYSKYSDSVKFIFVYRIYTNSNIYNKDTLLNQYANMIYATSFKNNFVNYLIEKIDFLPEREEHQVIVNSSNKVGNKPKNLFNKNISKIYYEIYYSD